MEAEKIDKNGNAQEFKCSVKNCQKKLKPGEEKRINGQNYCQQCAVLMWKQAFHSLE